MLMHILNKNEMKEVRSQSDYNREVMTEEIELLQSSFYKVYREYTKMEENPSLQSNREVIYNLKKNFGLYICFVNQYGMKYDLHSTQVNTATYNRIAYFLDAEKGKVDSLKKNYLQQEQAS